MGFTRSREGREEGAKFVDEMGGPQVYGTAMTVDKNMFDQTDAEARAEADVREGRLISHSAVRRWLQSWGRDKRLPRPRVGD